MESITYTDSTLGTIIECFLLTNPLGIWATTKVRLNEHLPGIWTGILDNGNWGVFEGGTQPASLDESVGTFVITTEVAGSLAEEIKLINDTLGPKRIKTPNMETEDHDLKDLLYLQRTTTVVRPHFSNFAFAKAVPKGGCSCEDSVTQSTCNRNY